MLVYIYIILYIVMLYYCRIFILYKHSVLLLCSTHRHIKYKNIY